MSAKKASWRVSGPHFADGWYFVANTEAVVPELTQQWFQHRAPARAYRNALQRGRWKTARHIRKEAV
jgi:hypothetical protein